MSQDPIFLQTPSGKQIKVEIADNDFERIKGLSNRQSLKRDTGMLFKFEIPGYHGIWMKDMNFPIDILWFDESYKVLDLKSNISPETYPAVFTPKSKARNVLELNSGDAAKFNIKIGDKLIP